LRWDDQEENSEDSNFPVKAVTSIEKVSLVTISGASFLGTPGVAKRMMEALGNAGVNVILTSQGSSEHSITVAVDERDELKAVSSVQQAFAPEIATEDEIRVSAQGSVAIMAVIGEGMKCRPGISGRFLNALGQAKVNVIAIAQGSSERNISVVVAREDLSRALRGTHSSFTLSDVTLAVGIIGTGKVGCELMKQLKNFNERDETKNSLPALQDARRLNIELRAACDENLMILSDHGMPPMAICGEESSVDLRSKGTSLKEVLEKDSGAGNTCVVEEVDFSKLEEFIDANRIPHKVLIDCSGGQNVADMYSQWIKRGIHVITVNRLGVCGQLHNFYKCLTGPASLQYESCVGGQMPVISIARDLMQTGDNPLNVEGVVSGTMSYIFNRIHADENMTFSQAFAEAKDKGLLSTDPTLDVSGYDTAQKMLIIAREFGMKVEMEDVKVEPLLTSCDKMGPDFDADMTARCKEAAAKGERLCYVGDIDVNAGTVTCGLKSLPSSHRLVVMRSSETGLAGNNEVNDAQAKLALVFITQRYPAHTPLCVQGPGTGPIVTAAGIMADLMRLSRQLGR